MWPQVTNHKFSNIDHLKLWEVVEHLRGLKGLLGELEQKQKMENVLAQILEDENLVI